MAIVLAYGAPAELIVVGIAGSRREHASADGEVVFVDASGSGGICTYLESEVRPSHWLVSFTCIIIHLKLLSSLANFYTIICRSLPYRDIVHCNGG